MKEKLGQKIYKISGIFGAYARAYKSKVDQPVVVVKKKVVEGRRKGGNALQLALCSATSPDTQ